MSEQEKEYARRVYEEVLKVKTSGTRSMFDLAIGYRLGFTPEEMAEAITGRNRRVAEALIAEEGRQ